MNFTARQNVLDVVAKKIPERSIIAIDGCGASGKSTLAAAMEQVNRQIRVVHVDDLYLPSTGRKMIQGGVPVGGNYDLQRLLEQVILPFRRGESARYRKYDWVKDCLEGEEVVEPERVLLIEGVYSLHELLRQYYDLKIWIDCPRDTRLRRGIARDGEGLRSFWVDEWMPLEDEYLKTSPWLCADYIIDGMFSGC